MDPDSSRLRVAVTDGQGRPVRAPGLGRWLQSVAPARAAGMVAIALVSDAEIRTLNRRYRRVNQPTDVLAFPSDPDPAEIQKPGFRSPTSKADRRPKPKAQSPKPDLLGDLVIATGVARRQAADAKHSYATELKILALHGLLHLLGYDHHALDDGGRMARAEARLRRAGGLTAGLIERAAAGNSAAGRPPRPR